MVKGAYVIIEMVHTNVMLSEMRNGQQAKKLFEAENTKNGREKEAINENETQSE